MYSVVWLSVSINEKRTRVVVGWLPRLVGEILMDVIGQEEDMQAVDALAAEASPLKLARKLKADVLLISSTRNSSEYSELLRAHPNLKLFGLTPDGRTAFQYVLRLERHGMNEVSAQDLLDAIRSTAVMEGDPT